MAAVMRMLAAVRWREWYASKVPFAWTACAVAAASSPLGAHAILRRSALIIIFTCCCGAFGHLVNDLADRVADSAVGKRRELSDRDPRGIALLAGGCVAGAVGALILTDGGWATIIAGTATVLSAALYSVPPVQLKRRGAAGVWSAAAAQRTLPVLTAFAAVSSVSSQAWAFAAVAQLAGLRAMLVHQIADAGADRRTHTPTYVVRAGEPRASRLLGRLVFPLELAAVLLAVWLEARTAPGAWLILAVGMLAAVAWAAVWPSPRDAFALQDSERQPLTDLYLLVWPLGASALLLADRPGLWPLGAAYAVWESRYLAARLKTTSRLLRARLRTLSDPTLRA
jgi:4-hydroxybenzoate polyprenyltransferase